MSQWYYPPRWFQGRQSSRYPPTDYPHYKTNNYSKYFPHRASLYDDSRSSSTDSFSGRKQRTEFLDGYQREGNSQVKKIAIAGAVTVLLIVALMAVLLPVLLTRDDPDSTDDTTTAAGSTTQNPSEVVTYSVTGEVVLANNQIGPYISLLASSATSTFQQYQNTFCNEITPDGSGFVTSQAEVECSTRFSQNSGRLRVSFDVSVEDPGSAVTDPNSLSFQLANLVYEKLMDTDGEIQGVPQDSIMIDGISRYTVEGVTIITNRLYVDSMANPESSEFRSVEQAFCDGLLNGMQTNDVSSQFCSVLNIESGSLVVGFEVGVVTSNQNNLDAQVAQTEQDIITAVEQMTQFETAVTLTGACRHSPCQNGGTCTNTNNNGFTCNCAQGYLGSTCEEENVCILANPCQNGGSCAFVSDGQFSCSCTDGYKDDTCSTERVCKSGAEDPCGGRGVCGENDDDTQIFSCACQSGYGGDSCQIEIQCILNNPCENGATCRAASDGSVAGCTCTSGYKGPLCATEIVCKAGSENPCLNQGECSEDLTADSATYECSCASGYQGTRCEISNVCILDNPCENGALCNAEADGSFASCDCTADFKGTYCATGRVCTNDGGPCVNGGQCTENEDDTTTYECSNCHSGFIGANCDIVDSCVQNNPCNNGATCHTALDGSVASCSCTDDYKGDSCSVAKVCPVSNGGCLNGATCVETTESCECAAGFRGTHCETEDECYSNPCENQGVCLTNEDWSFSSCDCSATDFKGVYCATARVCGDDGPCQNGATCEELETDTTTYDCLCASGFTGTDCDSEIPDPFEYSVSGEADIEEANWPSAAGDIDHAAVFCEEVIPTDFFPAGTTHDCNATFTDYESPVIFAIAVTEPGIELSEAAYEEFVLDRRVQLAHKVVTSLADQGAGSIYQVPVDNITITGLILYHVAAQLVIDNKEFTEDMKDPSSAAFRELEEDVCSISVGDMGNSADSEVECTLLAVEPGSVVLTVEFQAVSSTTESKTEAMSQAQGTIKENVESSTSQQFNFASVEVASQMCRPGYGVSDLESELIHCDQCDIGFYKDHYGNVECSQCPDGNITDGPGSTSVANCTVPDCPAGYYTRDTCVPCPVDTYQPDTRQQICLPCPDTYITLQEASTALEDCVAGAEYDVSPTFVWDNADFPFVDELHDQNSELYADYSEAICSEFDSLIEATEGRSDCAILTFSTTEDGGPLTVQLTLTIHRVLPDDVTDLIEYIRAQVFQLGAHFLGLVQDEEDTIQDVGINSINIPGVSIYQLGVVAVMAYPQESPSRRRRKRDVDLDTMQDMICGAMEERHIERDDFLEFCEVTHMFPYREDLSVMFEVTVMYATDGGHSPEDVQQEVRDMITEMLQEEFGATPSFIGATCEETDCEEECEMTEGVPECQCGSGSIPHDDGMHCSTFYPLIFPNNTAAEIIPNSQFSIRCIAIADSSFDLDRITTKWVKDNTGEVVETDFEEQVLISESAPGEQRRFTVMTFLYADPEHSGSYVCQASYDAPDHTLLISTSIDVHVRACKVGYFQCVASLSDVRTSQRADLSMFRLTHSPPLPSSLDCIEESRRCDGRFDCESKNDEHDCPGCTAENNKFRCHNGVCIDINAWCDGNSDCDDNSDEFNCGLGCADDEFTCPSGFCLPGSLTCNGQTYYYEYDFYRRYSHYDFYTDYNDYMCDCPATRYNTTDAVTCDDELFCPCPDDTMDCPGGNGGCVRGNQICDGEKNCNDWSDEEDCDYDCPTSSFQCRKGFCIPWFRECDGRNDCFDWSDELHCSCRHGFYKCESSGVCINQTAFCDGRHDCPGEEDEEEGCVADCDPDMQFPCESDGVCIPKWKECNKIIDCDNGADEMNCVCKRNETRCNNGVCLDRYKWCNGQIDCADGSDEEENCFLAMCPPHLYIECDPDSADPEQRCINVARVCDRVLDCPETLNDENDCVCDEHEMRCDNGLCLSDSIYCNGIDECGDGSDEPSAGNPCSVCPPNKIQCSVGNNCYYPSEQCNGYLNCRDPPYDDENDCTCTEDEFQCSMGMCLSKTLWCDGESDCPDDSDEPDDCECNEYQFTCSDGLCIPLENECDSLSHCPDGSDEDPELCPCPDGEYKCDNYECVPQELVCDDFDDCGDYSDEGPSAGCTCGIGERMCDIGTCTFSSRWCDGYIDCPDGSDERRECESGCSNDTLVCYTDLVNFECVPSDYNCDGYPDCVGASDERDCACTSRRCHWGLCLNSDDICDGSNDCFDFSDEIGCGECDPYEIRCNASTVTEESALTDFYCVPYDMACDEINDCPFGEDESDEICQFEIFNSCGDLGNPFNASQGGTFASPNFPRNYDNDMSCEWDIMADPGFVVITQFTYFNTERGYDFLKVHDVLFNDQLIRASGLREPFPVVSYTEHVRVIFESDFSITRKGFVLEYSQIHSDMVTYPPNEETTEISGFGGSCYGSCGGSSSGCYCDSMCLAIGDCCDDYIDACCDGFRENCESPTTDSPGQECGGELDANEPGVIQSPNYPQLYDNSLFCQWTLTTGASDIGIQLTIVDFELESCCDTVEIDMNGSQNESETLTGTLESFILRGSDVTVIILDTDSSVRMRGFSIYYQPIKEDCVQALGLERGTIFTPNHPNDYDNDSRCSWVLNRGPGSEISLQFTSFNIENGSDIVYISDGIEQNSMYTGNQLPPPIESTSLLFVTFTSDSRNTASGFNASFSQVPGEIPVFNETTPNPGGSCYGSCGNSSSGCFCDQSCLGFGDCCDDYIDACCDGFRENCESATTESPGISQFAQRKQRLRKIEAENIAAEVREPNVQNEEKPIVKEEPTGNPRAQKIMEARHRQTSRLMSIRDIGPLPPPDCESGSVFPCTESGCVYQFQRCDGSVQCADGSDEARCNCSAAEFTCADGNCVLAARHCDGIDDCRDNSDEWFCGCHDDSFHCRSRGLCVLNRWKCDGYLDCSDPHDEDEDMCNNCDPELQFQCPNRECIDLSQVCDGTSDCNDGSDEGSCLSIQPFGAYRPGPVSENRTLHAVCASDEHDVNVQVADLACKEKGFKGSLSLTTSMDNTPTNVIVVQDPIPKTSIRAGARFWAAEDFRASCPSNSILTDVVCEEFTCGEPSVDPEAQHAPNYVVNGDNAKIEAWPWMASLRLYGSHLCGGTLINDQWILTAAHCNQELSAMRVHLGIESLEDSSPRSVSHFINHPDYRAFGRGGGALMYFGNLNDIALVKLQSPVTFSDRIKPVCLADEHLDINSARRAYVVGWGQQDPERGSSAPTYMQQGKMEALPIENIHAWYHERWRELYPFNIPHQPPVMEKYHICAGSLDHNGVDACYGDSGGPLMGESTTGQWFQYGIVSSGPVFTCDRFTIYARIDVYRDWMESVMEEYGRNSTEASP